MLSPLPIQVDITGALPSPAQFGLASPGWALNSPLGGRSPGAYVVQEARLSLEMFGLSSVEHQRQRNHAEALDLLAIDAMAKAPGALHKAPSTAHLEPVAPPQAQASLTPAVDQEEGPAKLAQYKEALAKMGIHLRREVEEMVEDAKKELALKNCDEGKVKQVLDQMLTEAEKDGGIPGLQLEHGPAGPRIVSFDVEKMQAQLGEKKQAEYDEMVANEMEPARRGTKRAYPGSVEEYEEAMPARKRMENMKTLENRLQGVQARNAALRDAVNQAETRARAARGENEQLWAAAAHIMTAVAAAIDVRRQTQQAQAPAMPEGQQQQQAGPSTDAAPNTQAAAPQGQQAPLVPNTTGFTPFGMFSPAGDDLFAACGMFVSPLGFPGSLPAKQNPTRLFGTGLKEEQEIGDKAVENNNGQDIDVAPPVVQQRQQV